MTEPRLVSNSLRLSVAKVHAIIDLFDEGCSRNEIARRLQLAKHTVTKVCRENDRVFDTSRTSAASEARMAQLKEDEVDLAEDLLEDAHLLRERAWSPHTEYVMRGDKMIPYTIPLPDAMHQRDFYTSLQIAMDTYVKVMERHEGQGSETKKSALTGLLEGLSKLAEIEDTGGEVPDLSGGEEFIAPTDAQDSGAK